MQTPGAVAQNVFSGRSFQLAREASPRSGVQERLIPCQADSVGAPFVVTNPTWMIRGVSELVQHARQAIWQYSSKAFEIMSSDSAMAHLRIHPKKVVVEFARTDLAVRTLGIALLEREAVSPLRPRTGGF